MDILSILTQITQGLSLAQIISGLVVGWLAAKFWDQLLLVILLKYWPEKAIEKLLGIVRKFDAALDKLEDKYPKAVSALRTKLAKFLDDAEQIILDK